MSAHKVIIALEVLIFAVLVLFVITNSGKHQSIYGSSCNRRSIINAIRKK